MAKRNEVLEAATPVATNPDRPERPPTHRQDKLLTFKEAACQIGIHPDTLARWANQHGRRRLKTVRLPSGRRKVRQSVINEILKATAENGDASENLEQEG